jgi:hypothetical protein
MDYIASHFALSAWILSSSFSSSTEYELRFVDAACVDIGSPDKGAPLLRSPEEDLEQPAKPYHYHAGLQKVHRHLPEEKAGPEFTHNWTRKYSGNMPEEGQNNLNWLC